MKQIKRERKALIYFSKSLVLKEDSYQVLNNRGVTHFLLNDLDLAINDFKQSLVINSKVFVLCLR